MTNAKALNSIIDAPGLAVAAACMMLAMGGALAGRAEAQTPPTQTGAAPVLKQDQIFSVVETIATAAAERYSEAEAGAVLARHLRKRLADGAYGALTIPSDLATTLTEDMRAAVPDVHLRATHDPGRAPTGRVRVQGAAGAVGAGGNLARVDGRSDAQIARSNFGFERVERLGGNVGYLKLTQFVPPELSMDTAVAAMGFLGSTDAMIVDLRGVPGGSPDLVRRLISWFTGPEPVRLMASYNRATNETDELWSVAEAPGRRMTGRPLYVLQDGDTASAAEMFGYFVQRQHLGVIVGETSAGAGNGGAMIDAGSDIFVFLPQRRVVDGPGWERTGVAPDMPTKAANALDVAHLAALAKLGDAATEPALKRELDWTAELVRASQGGVVLPNTLGDFAGRFGARTFEAGEDGLALVSATGRQILTRSGPDVFRGQRTRFTFNRAASGLVDSVTAETLAGETRRDPRS